jgi:hypothetical protein
MSTKCHQKCPRDVTSFVHEMSPIMSTTCLPSEAIVISVFVKYIDRNLREHTGTPHVKKSSYRP